RAHESLGNGPPHCRARPCSCELSSKRQQVLSAAFSDPIGKPHHHSRLLTLKTSSHSVLALRTHLYYSKTSESWVSARSTTGESSLDVVDICKVAWKAGVLHLVEELKIKVQTT